MSSFSEAFHFVIQPSRPVSNFLIAVTSYLGKNTVTPHRVLSLILHAVATLLLYANLTLAAHRLGNTAPSRGLCFVMALLFAIHPLNAATIGIALFRWEILAMVFMLTATLAAQHLARGEASRGKKLELRLIIFFSLGLAHLSKETYAVIAPIAILLFYYVPVKKEKELDWRFGPELIFADLFWAAILIWLLNRPTLHPYEMQLVGLPAADKIIYIASAVIEQIAKITTGRNLTLTALVNRPRIGDAFGVETAAAILLSLTIAWSFIISHGRWYFLWGCIFGIGTCLYLLLPVATLGSEHYWYFISAAGIVLLISPLELLLKKKDMRPEKLTAQFGLVIYGLSLFFAMECRVLDLRSRADLFEAEIELTPHNPLLWLNHIEGLFLEHNGYAKAAPYIDRAVEQFPRNPHFRLAKFTQLYSTRQYEAAWASLRKMDDVQMPPLRRAFIWYSVAKQAARIGDCARSMQALEEALEYSPDDPLILEASRRLSSLASSSPERCKPSSRLPAKARTPRN